MKLAPLVLLPMLLLAGCAGGAKEVSPDATLVPTEAAPTNDTAAPPTDEFVPKFHTHDYWSGRDKLILFDGKIMIGSDTAKETYYEDDRLTIGRVDFDTKTDGEDINLADATDVVFQGTSHILVTIKWTDTQNIPGLRFFFKPANTPTFTLLSPAVTSGTTYEIPLKQGWADMPHQLSLSRWKFRLEAVNPQTESFPIKAASSKGEVTVTMEIVNGGERFIDPPHPYFFLGGPVRYAGEVNATLNNCVVVNNSKPGGQPLPISSTGFSCGADTRGPMEYKVDGSHIVPWETTKMRVSLYWNESGQPAAGVKLGLIFHGGDSDVYRYPKAVASTSNSATYEIGVTESMSDSPYATQSDWRYGVYPILQDQRDYGGAFTGKFHIVAHAIKEGDTAGRGMGN